MPFRLFREMPGARNGESVDAVTDGSRIKSGSRKIQCSAATSFTVSWVLSDKRQANMGAIVVPRSRASADQYRRESCAEPTKRYANFPLSESGPPTSSVIFWE